MSGIEQLRYFIASILICFSFLLLISCDSSTDSNDCGPKTKIDTTATLSADGSTVFSFVTPPARKDCHAEFDLLFGYADPVKRESDPTKPSLDWTFQVYPGFFYFIAPNAELWEKEDGYWWHAEISEGAKNQDDEYVQYQIECTLGNVNHDIMIKAEIKYNPYK